MIVKLFNQAKANVSIKPKVVVISTENIFISRYYLCINKEGEGEIRPALKYSQLETGITDMEEILPYQ